MGDYFFSNCLFFRRQTRIHIIPVVNRTDEAQQLDERVSHLEQQVDDTFFLKHTFFPKKKKDSDAKQMKLGSGRAGGLHSLRVWGGGFDTHTHGLRHSPTPAA